MKYIVLVAIGLAIALAVGIIAASGQTTTFRDQFGRTTGQSRIDSSGTEHFSDAFGRSTGTARPDSNGTTRFYDSFGRYQGSATTPGATRR